MAWVQICLTKNATKKRRMVSKKAFKFIMILTKCGPCSHILANILKMVSAIKEFWINSWLINFVNIEWLCWFPIKRMSRILMASCPHVKDLFEGVGWKGVQIAWEGCMEIFSTWLLPSPPLMWPQQPQRWPQWHIKNGSSRENVSQAPSIYFILIYILLTTIYRDFLQQWCWLPPTEKGPNDRTLFGLLVSFLFLLQFSKYSTNSF